MYKEIEEIRRDSGMTQSEFARYIGTARRTYLNRITGERPRWYFEELIKVAELNEGEVIVSTDGTKYRIKIETVD